MVGYSGFSPLALSREYLTPALSLLPFAHDNVPGWACHVSKQGGTTSSRCPRPCEVVAFFVSQKEYY